MKEEYWNQSKNYEWEKEFATVLADQQVKHGGTITLKCEAKTEELTAIWKKNGQRLDCVQDKHTIKQNGKSFTLEIKNAEEKDEGDYTITLNTKLYSVSCSAKVTTELNEWREIKWNQAEMIDTLRAFRIRNGEVKQLCFLVNGPVGVGKSSIINTIKTIFEGRPYVNYLAASGLSQSQTIYYKKCEVGNTKDGFLPFTFHDTMGIQKDENGLHTDDIISALKGHVKDGYPFNPTSPLTEHNLYYCKNPDLKDRIHCLVNVIPADKISILDDKVIQKMKKVRDEASKLDLPQVVFMTRVDKACPLTAEDLHNVYKSKKIKQNMEKCSGALGVPLNCIFPVKNYYKETEISEDINCLMLHALTKIVLWADDYAVEYSRKQTSAEG
ncbi:interferon-induced protein 44-like [Salminus brasiliensis]|uniref:interferon-induced protein 44-like n=1 Tax=Salminus brasiliensis TaxID=930266 RepID=UPI003B830020